MSTDQCKLNANECGIHTHAHHCRAFHRVSYRQSIGHYIAHWYIAIESTLYPGRTGRLSLGDPDARPNGADPH